MSLDNIKTPFDTNVLYKEIVEKFWARLFKFCCIYIRDKDAAKDITQDVFLSLWENKDKLISNRQIAPYLMVACRNRCLNYIRDRQLEYSLETDMTEEQIFLKINRYALEDIPSALLESLDLHNAIKEVLSSLRPRTREIFLLKYYEGLTIGEISSTVNLTEKAVRYHLSKSIKELKKRLSPSEFIIILFFLSI